MGDDYASRAKGDRGPDGIANEIIFKRNYPGNELLSFLLVEGETDRTFYMNIVNTKKCQIISASNKSMVVQVLSILDRIAFAGVLAIVDADFDILEDKLPTSPNLCYTDSHDLETMLLQSPALEKVLGEFGSAEKIAQVMDKTGKNIRTLLLECGIALGYLRWVSLRENLSLTFEELRYIKFMQQDALALDQAQLIQTVIDKSHKPRLVVAELQASIRKLQSDTHNPWHVCCGHDLVCLLSHSLHKAIGRGQNDAKHAGPESLTVSLRLAFEQAYFYKTKLYVYIKQWESGNAPYVIVATP